MATNRQNRYNPDFEKRHSKSSARKKSPRSKDTGSFSESDLDTNSLSSILENDADEHIQKTRRNTTYRSGSDSTGPVRRHTQELNPSSVEERLSRDAALAADEERYRQRKKLRREAAAWRRAHWIVRSLIVIVLLLDLIILRFGVFKGGFLPVWNVLTSGGKSTVAEQEAPESGISISEQLLTVNEYSRPGTALDAVNGIVIHYIGNPGTDAQANHDYFENLKDGASGVYASCNYIIGLDGTIIHCVPDDEVAYASSERNNDTISVECCHPDDSGAFTQETFQSLVLLTAKLCQDHGLTTEQVIRHYDVNNKPCPKYFVDDPNAWTNFLASVDSCIQ